MILKEMDALQALQQFYSGEEMGVWEGDFMKYEIQNAVFIPALLKEFLQKYGYFSVNQGVNSILLPEYIKRIYGNGPNKDMVLIGVRDEAYAGVLLEESTEDNPVVFFGESAMRQDGSYEPIWSFQDSGLRLLDFLLLLFIENLSAQKPSVVYEDIQDIEHMADTCTLEDGRPLDTVLYDKERPGFSIYWNEEEEQFLAVILHEDSEVFLTIPQGLTLDELEKLFHQEFYQNALHCDFAHALKLLKEIIRRMEKEADANTDKLAENYKLAGRCCWELQLWEEAVTWYQKAEQAYQKELYAMYDRLQSFYTGLGNFYHAKVEEAQSEAAYDRAADYQHRMKAAPDKVGNLLLTRGMNKSADMAWEEAIELYNQALTEFQKDPKACKYEIDRTQQLRGEARKKWKESKKQG